MSKPQEDVHGIEAGAEVRENSARNRKPRRRRWMWIAGIVVALGAAAAVSLPLLKGEPENALAAEETDEGTDEEETKRVPVALATAREATLPNYFHATGTLEARRHVDLIAKIGGQITRLAVEEGDPVRTGQVLLEIDHREARLLADEAKVKAQTAQLELKRIADMAERGLETERAFEEAKQTADVAQAQFELAQVRLDDHFLRAPFDGHVSVRHVELGQTVQNGHALLGVVDAGPLEVRLFLPDQIVHRLEVGQSVEIRPDVADGAVLEGEVARIAPVVDAATSTVKVTLTVAGGADVARVGSFVRARITTDRHHDVVAVPKKAIVAEAGANFLFVAEADTVRRVDVATGYADDRWIEVQTGVIAGDRVVVVGQGGLREGSHIEELQADGATGGPQAEEEPGDDETRLAQGR